MYGLAIEMLSTDTKEHLCMCEHLKWNENEKKNKMSLWIECDRPKKKQQFYIEMEWQERFQ